MVTRRQLQKLRKQLNLDDDNVELVLFMRNEEGIVENTKTGETYTPKEMQQFKKKARAEGDPVIELSWEG